MSEILEIVQAIKDKSCVVFAGAGISRDAGLPDWLALATELYERLKAKGHIPEVLQGTIGQLVSSRETFQIGLDNIAMVTRRSELATVLREILKPKSESQVHLALAGLDLKGFVTTNYDRLLNRVVSDQSWKLSNSLPELKLVHSAVNSQDSQFLLKLHGDIDNALPPDDMKVVQGGPFLVLSKADYLVLKSSRLDSIRLAMHAILQQCSVMFLGYSFGDPYILEILEFLTEHCQFSKQSWFVGLKGDRLPPLPANVAAIQPFESWAHLPQWIETLNVERRKLSPASTKSVIAVSKVTDETKSALTALSEYLHGLESDDLPSKTIVSILVPSLSEKTTIDLEWVCQFVQKVLNIGPIWAETFAARALNQLRDLKLISFEEGVQQYRVVSTRVAQIQKRSRLEWEDDKTSFTASIRRRLAKAGQISDSFLSNLDLVFQHLCLGFGKRMAEWIDGGIGRELGLSHIRELVSVYFDDAEERRIAEELLGVVFEQPDDSEIGYIYRLLSSAFLLNSVKLDPTATSFLKEYVSSYDLYLDSNVLLPLIIKEHKNHVWMASLLRDSKNAGCSLAVIEDILNEVFAHRAVTDTIAQSFGQSRKDLAVYLALNGDRGNCFVQGFLRAPQRSSSTLKEYLTAYNTKKILAVLTEFGIEVIPSTEVHFDRNAYSGMVTAIAEEWGRRGGGDTSGEAHGMRPDILNQNEAKQFLYLYHRRKDRISQGSSDNVWFLSFETILERVFLRDPTTWGKPPTFPVSAWASFLDSRLLSQPRNRKDILNAIIRGNSTSYSLPDSVSLVKKSVFGARVVSKEEAASVQVALSDGKFFGLLERLKKKMRKKTPREEMGIDDFQEELEKLNKEVQEDLAEQLQYTKRNYSKRLRDSDRRIGELEKEVATLRKDKGKRKAEK